MLKLCLVSCVVLILVSCTHLPQGYRSRNVGGISIVKNAELAGGNYQKEEFHVPFGKKRDGTEVVEVFLAKAKDKGARYVTDLSITLVTKKETDWEFCTTVVTPEGETTIHHETVYQPSESRTRYESRPVTQYVTEYERQCRMVSKPVFGWETHYEQEYDSFSKSYRSVPRSRPVTHYESQQECQSTPVSRTVTRYETQLTNEYIPAKWETISKAYTKWKLVENAPSCTRSKEGPSTVETPNFVRGLIYKGSALKE